MIALSRQDSSNHRREIHTCPMGHFPQVVLMILPALDLVTSSSTHIQQGHSQT